MEKEIKLMKKVIKTKFAPEAIGPYSQAILSGNTLYCSGQIALDPLTGKLIDDNIEKEIEQVMQNILAILNASDMSFDNVVKCTIFMIDLKDYKIINEIYSNFFGNTPPAREAIEVSKLPKNANLEISVIAIK